jgi:hypothetical protein
MFIAIVVYIKTFKENFNEENIQKIVPELFAAGVIIVVLLILSAIS